MRSESFFPIFLQNLLPSRFSQSDFERGSHGSICTNACSSALSICTCLRAIRHHLSAWVVDAKDLHECGTWRRCKGMRQGFV